MDLQKKMSLRRGITLKSLSDRFSENKDRLFWDFIETSILVWLLIILFRRVLDIDLSIELPYHLSMLIVPIAAIIAFLHLLFCLFSDEFFRKFAFLMPGDYYYYIFIKNNSRLQKNISVTIKNANLVFPFPNKDTCTSPLQFTIDNSYVKEAKRILLWLQKNGPDDSSVTIDGDRYYLEIIVRQFNNTCNKMGLEYIYLLLSKNVILLLARSLIMTLIFLVVLFQNPPLMIDVNPCQIQENLTYGQDHFIYISTKNIGCDLFNPRSETISFNKSLINASFVESDPIILCNETRFVRLHISDKCPEGEYRGSIIIAAKANRRWIDAIPDWIQNKTLISSDLGETYLRELAEVPYIIRISPA